MALAAVSRSATPQDVASKYKTHDEKLRALSTELKTAQAAAAPLKDIKNLFWLVVPVSIVLIRFNPVIFFPVAIVSIIVETVASYYFTIHSVTISECEKHIDIQMGSLIELEEGQLTPAKKEVLKKHPNICSYLSMTRFVPGTTWEKAKAWLIDKYPQRADAIKAVEMPQRVPYETLNHVAGRIKAWEEEDPEGIPRLIKIFLKKHENSLIVTYHEAEEMVNLISPAHIHVPYRTFHTPKIDKLAISRTSFEKDMTFSQEIAGYTHIQDLVKEDASAIKAT